MRIINQGGVLLDRANPAAAASPGAMHGVPSSVVKQPLQNEPASPGRPAYFPAALIAPPLTTISKTPNKLSAINAVKRDMATTKYGLVN